MITPVLRKAPRPSKLSRIQLNIEIDADDRKTLRDLSRLTGAPKSHHVRAALRKYFAVELPRALHAKSAKGGAR